MLNFTYHVPTKILFGKGQVSHLAEEIKRFWDKILLTYGSWSIKTNGIYDQVIDILKQENIQYRELWDIEPNPDITSVRAGIALCKEHGIQSILAVWGWSTIDASKAIALGHYYQGDARDIFSKPVEITQALPLGTILTLAATWSEMNSWMVISNRALQEKRVFKSGLLCPQFSILDPTYTFSLPVKQTVAGVVDIMSHVFEQYFSLTESTEIQDSLAEWILQTCIYYSHKVLIDPEDYDARANLMRAGSLALNGLTGLGKQQDRATHTIEHALSAVYDITHGDWLAIITPHWMEYVLGDGTNQKILDKFLDLATRVRNIPPVGDPLVVAKKWIQSVRKFWTQLWAPSTLREVDVVAPDISVLVDKILVNGPIWSFVSLWEKEVIEILENSM